MKKRCHELQTISQCKIIKLYGHKIRRENTERIKAIINSNPNGKKPRSKPKKW